MKGTTTGDTGTLTLASIPAHHRCIRVYPPECIGVELVSALIAPAGRPAAIFSAWVEGKFTLLACAAHLDELLATLQKPRVAELVKPYKAGRLVNLH